ncbi:hypothetical protein [Endozoicomonas sp. 8E]|uniref:hypothetical protein n=1 Tax=Endozoicomonas sp. 8E TaxID=3035692 RepID=UPI002938D409|nr:hypothetical protein [Endozoicomonas sp. 8E]WOG28887.1 hypothetical protein P6910_04280 [Endozoicomonas sp. 8E]WOG28889.1 hypothetical protein P6910_04290 [Endozoicomonas sp. 8E]
MALDSRLRGNDDLRAWERAVGVLRHPRRRVSQNSLQGGNELTPVIPDFILVIPDFILVIPDFILVIPDFILVIPDFILVIPAKAGIHTDSPPEPYCPVPP